MSASRSLPPPWDPLPERGSGSKKEHGKEISQPKLPAADAAAAETIRMYIPEHTDETVQAEEDPEIARWVERERAEEHRIVVPDEIRKYHPLVAATKRWFEQRRKKVDIYAKPELIHHLHVVKVQQDSELRVLHLWDALIRAIEARGWSVETTKDRDTKTTVNVLGESVRIFIEERLDSKPHELTAKEQKLVAEHRAYGIPKYDHSGTGVLKLTIDEYGAKQTFTDRKDRPLEVQLNDVILALVRTAITVVRPKRLESEEVHRRWEEQQRRAALEQRRSSQFGELLQHWTKHEQERTLLGVVEDAVKNDPDVAANDDVEAWLRWAREHVGRRDPVRLYLRAIVSGKAQ
ncbi:MAG: hypothetical protein WA208_18115 [Thermoanaerobaculia bacterium]